MKAKKVLCIVLSSAMICSLAGCSGAGKEAAQQQSGSGSADAQNTSADKLPDQDLAGIVRDMNGIFPEPIDINIGYSERTYQGSETVYDNAWMDLYKKHGLNVNVMYTTSGNETEKLNQMIMSGDYPDFFYAGLTDYLDYVNQGLVLDITEYYDDYLSDAAKEYLEYDGGASVQKATVDGRIYGIPQMGSFTDGIPELWVRRDWLEALHLEVPKTAEELAEVAKAFTYEDPDGNGINDTYGFSMNGKDDNGISQAMLMFGVSPEARFVEKDGQLVWLGEDSGKSEYGLKLLSDMYEEGTIAPDFITSDAVQLMTDFASGKVGMAIGSFSSMMSFIADGLKLNDQADYIAVPMPSSEVNPEGYMYKGTSTVAIWCVSSKCKNPEALFKIYNMSIDYICNNPQRTQEEYEMYCGGKEGMYTGKAAAVIPYIDNPADNYNNYKTESKALGTGSFDGLTPVQKSHVEWISFFLDHKDKMDELSQEDWSAFNLGASYYSVFGSDDIGYGGVHKTVLNDKWLEEGFLGLQTSAMSTASANCMPLVPQTLTAIIMGTREPETYGEFVNEWKAAGGQELLDAVNEWYSQNK